MRSKVHKKIIAIDIDDTVADATDALRLLVNMRLGIDLKVSDYRDKGEYWGYYERVWSHHGISHLVDFISLNAEMEVDQSHVPLLPGAEFALRQLKVKYHIVYVTSRNPSWESATRKWFSNHFEDEIVVHFAERNADGKSETKGQICKRLGAGILIDDNYEHCMSAVKEGVTAVLYGDYGWQPAVKNQVVHCVDWQAVLEYLDAQ
jgi:uncharacterized HAD superfamily protein